VDTVDFLNPIEVGELVTMKASVNYVIRTSMIIGIRVDSENIRTGKIKHCNSSYFTMVSKNENGESVEVPKLILFNFEEVRRFYKSTQHVALKKQKDLYVDSFDHKSKEALENLSKYNVKLEL